MLSFTKTFPARAFTVAALGAVASLTSQVSGALPVAAPKPPVPLAKASVTRTVTAAAAVAAIKPATPPVLKLAPAPLVAKLGFEESVRASIKFETVRWGGKPVKTLDEASRILLAKAAAEKAGLREVGLSFHDVYGVIEAETSWIQRTGASKDGTPNLGLAQFEPRTARGLGVKDPEDPVQAVFAAAIYMKHGAKWAANRLTPLKLHPEVHAAKVREGVSVYYNLSIKGRNKWTGFNTAEMPIETQKHIRNAGAGAKEAAELVRKLSA